MQVGQMGFQWPLLAFSVEGIGIDADWGSTAGDRCGACAAESSSCGRQVCVAKNDEAKTFPTVCNVIE